MEPREGPLEYMGLTQFSDCYRNRSVLVTGHTGFKGSWLASWLQTLGSEVSGVALDPCTHPNHWDVLSLEISDYRCDIRDFQKLNAIIAAIKPEIVFHLAAQPLVRHSYDAPLDTWSTNVMGSANLLEACRHCDTVCAIIAITTDKVYCNREWPWGYRENDRLGGQDPYSASKSACEVLIESYRQSFFNSKDSPLLASARSGNVIGGGDWSADRLVTDVVLGIIADRSIEIRSPFSTRPWQHVLDCITGYLMLGEKLLKGEHFFADAWNFGPEPDCNRTVEYVLEIMRQHWSAIKWYHSETAHPHETKLLYLDSTKARSKLHWAPVWDLEQAVSKTIDWYRSFYQDKKVLTGKHLDVYVQQAKKNKCSWITLE